MEQIEEEASRGSIIRSRAQWIEEGEKCSKYFMQLENRNYKSKCINMLLTDKNTITKQNEILEECKQFYENLYSGNVKCSLENCRFFDGEHNTLNDLDRNICESKITIDECKESLMKLTNNRSPGSDGISVEFYKFFWDKLKKFLIDSYNYAFENDILSIEQRRAILILIPKGTKDKRLLKNWRPISLLNVDYKILAKGLAIRLQKVISNLVSLDQVGCIKERYIGNNIRTMLDILEITKNKLDPGLMVMIDFEKAFDTISWSFLYKTLEYFNFGQTFIHYIKLLYTSPVSCVTNNGFHTQFFNIKRGVRQGCPISALLFILCVEVLAINIREHNDIKGIPIGKKGNQDNSVRR